MTMKGHHVTVILVVSVLVGTIRAAPVPPKASPQKVCYEWVQPLFDFLTLKEGRDMRRTDFSRFFSYMDNTLTGKVSQPEFVSPWQGATQMTVADARRVFMQWAQMKEKEDPTHITKVNQDAIWMSFDPKQDTNTVTRQGFATGMDKILKDLPNKGCNDGRFHYFD